LDDTREKVTLAMDAERKMVQSVELVDILSRIAQAERKLEARNAATGEFEYATDFLTL
jgi:hypothetical protein